MTNHEHHKLLKCKFDVLKERVQKHLQKETHSQQKTDM